MAIDRANKPYDPSENKPGTTFNSQVGPGYVDHDDGPFRARLDPPPKPGISGGLLAVVLASAAITIIVVSALLILYK
jgi:hypothetical protein